MIEIRRLTAAEGRQHLGALAEVLLDCVQGGASVSFMESLSRAEAESFFENVIEGVQKGERILLGAFLDSKLVGTVQIMISMPPNQPHRADVAKLLVRRREVVCSPGMDNAWSHPRICDVSRRKVG